MDQCFYLKNNPNMAIIPSPHTPPPPPPHLPPPTLLLNIVQIVMHIDVYGPLVPNPKTQPGRKEGNVLINDTLNTFYLWLYGVRHIVKDHSNSEINFLINSKGSLICVIPQTE